MSATACSATLSGWIEGDTWTRWRIAGEGQVRFWVRPLGEAAGLLLCAVPVHTAADLREAADMLAPGRHVEIQAVPVPVQTGTLRQGDEAGACIVFLARELTSAGFPLKISARRQPAPQAEPLAMPHAPRIAGKMAAAGDTEAAA